MPKPLGHSAVRGGYTNGLAKTPWTAQRINRRAACLRADDGIRTRDPHLGKVIALPAALRPQTRDQLVAACRPPTLSDALGRVSNDLGPGAPAALPRRDPGPGGIDRRRAARPTRRRVSMTTSATARAVLVAGLRARSGRGASCSAIPRPASRSSRVGRLASTTTTTRSKPSAAGVRSPPAAGRRRRARRPAPRPRPPRRPARPRAGCTIAFRAARCSASV